MSEEERSRKREGLEMCLKGYGLGAQRGVERKARTYHRGSVLGYSEHRMGEDGWEEQQEEDNERHHGTCWGKLQTEVLFVR